MTAAIKTQDEAPACPEWQVLLDYRAGRLSDAARGELDTHVSVCTLCRAVLEELADEASGLDQRIAASLKHAPSTTDAFDRRLLELARPLTSLDATAPAPLVGQQLGPYRVLAEIGIGGMGRVYKARHATIDQVVALKVIRLRTGFDAIQRERFRVEAGALARLDHPNITRLYAFDASAAAPYFTMQWVDGRDLGKALLDGPLELREAAELVRTIAGAVEYCHRQEVYHRDLNPRNILVRKDGTPVVTDFGLAKLVDDESAGLTIDSAVMGTPSYMAPEQAEGRNNEVGPHTDVYALGAVLYACLTGKPPFVGVDKHDTLRLVREGDLVAPSGSRAGLPPDLEAVCLKCLERQADRRYPTAQELADDLDRWLNDRPTKVRPLGRIGHAWRAIRRRAKPLAATAVALVFVALLIATIPSDRDPKGPDTGGQKGTQVPRPSPEALGREVLRTLYGKLDRGEPVTLIGDTGKPVYHRWVCGEARSRLVNNQDGSFGALTDKVAGLLELLPNPRTDRYQLDCQIRHEDGGQAGAIGVYVARVEYAHSPKPIHLFLQVVFNDACRKPALVIVKRPHSKRFIDRNTTPVTLQPRLHMEEGPYPAVMGEYAGASGRNIPVLGPRNEKWHELRVKVTPKGVTAVLDGDEMHLPAARIVANVASGLKITKSQQQLRDDSLVQNLQPSFAPRGGVGLVITDGVVSVKRLVVDPLPAD
jgi:tRNA A-37 threonylcarbamoyl transferase component Bud32